MSEQSLEWSFNVSKLRLFALAIVPTVIAALAILYSCNAQPSKGKGAGKFGKPTATPIELIKVKKDFKVELLYSVPKDKQGSWVSLCVDPKGRLIASDQYGKLYRIT